MKNKLYCITVAIGCSVGSAMMASCEDSKKEVAEAVEATQPQKAEKKVEVEKPNLAGSRAGDLREFEIYPDVKVAFRWCPATGEQGFLMGSPASEKDRDDDEKQHKVVLSKGYWMQETEFTQGQWKAVMGSNPSWLTNAGLTAPVDQVSWDHIQECLKKLNGNGKLNAGVKAILPSEAQWEYACRAGTQTAFHYGNSLSSEQANFHGLNPYGDAAEGVHRKTTVAAGSYAANAWGLKDMHGNVWEWCSDRYGKDSYGAGAMHRDPMGPRTGVYLVLRGGSWDNSGYFCRSASRGWNRPSYRTNDIGFRLALQVPAE